MSQPPPLPPRRRDEGTQRRENIASVAREAASRVSLATALSSPLHQRPNQGGDTMGDLLRPMFPMHDGNASAVLVSLMDTLVQGRLDVNWNATLRSPLHAELVGRLHVFVCVFVHTLGLVVSVCTSAYVCAPVSVVIPRRWPAPLDCVAARVLIVSL